MNRRKKLAEFQIIKIVDLWIIHNANLDRIDSTVLDRFLIYVYFPPKEFTSIVISVSKYVFKSFSFYFQYKHTGTCKSNPTFIKHLHSCFYPSNLPTASKYLGYRLV